MFSADFGAALLTFLGREFLTAGRVEDRTAAVDRIRNAHTVHIYDFFLKESGVTTHDPLYLQSFIDSGSYNRTNCRVHSRGIAAAGQYSDRSDFFLCHTGFPPKKILSIIRHIRTYFNTLSPSFQ